MCSPLRDGMLIYIFWFMSWYAHMYSAYGPVSSYILSFIGRYIRMYAHLYGPVCSYVIFIYGLVCSYVLYLWSDMLIYTLMDWYAHIYSILRASMLRYTLIGVCTHLYSHFWSDISSYLLSCLCWYDHMCCHLWAGMLIYTFRFGLLCSHVLSFWVDMPICTLLGGWYALMYSYSGLIYVLSLMSWYVHMYSHVWVDIFTCSLILGWYALMYVLVCSYVF